jgi:phosphatidylserine decarboxylase
MKFHKEGRKIIATTIVLAVLVNLLVYLIGSQIISVLVGLGTLIMVVLVLQFFRVPKRIFLGNDDVVIAPADGKVVVIEETTEDEVLKDKRIQISIFMSPLNVHINWYPISGMVKYFKYHKGKYLVAWHPKSSTENERTTVMVEHEKGHKILFRQIAGAVARRIVCYSKPDKMANQGEEFGFIKFGSRVDVFLPLGSKVLVNIDDKTKGLETVLAELPKE